MSVEEVNNVTGSAIKVLQHIDNSITVCNIFLAFIILFIVVYLFLKGGIKQ